MNPITQITFTILIFACAFAPGCGRVHTESAPAPSAEVAAGLPLLNPNDSPAIRFLEDRVSRDPDDFIARNKLASEYLQRLRETGDVVYLDLARQSANASLKTLPAEQNKGGLASLIQVEFASHEFTSSLEHSTRLVELEPNKGYPYQFLGDSLLELGRYDEASAAFKTLDKLSGIQQMTHVAIEQRLARMALLNGDTAGAAKHFTVALKIAGRMIEPPKETIAWCQWQLGEVAFGSGDHAAAERHYRESLETLPDYFRSMASLGKLHAAKGEIAEAIGLYERVVKIMPDPSFAAALGDLYKLVGRGSDADSQYALVENIGRLNNASGVLYNRQLALFYADHDLKPEEAFASASKEYENRRDIYGADAVAWTALKAGKLVEAQAAAKEALKLGTRDARLFYHAGMIEKAAGNDREARRLLTMALKNNPGFDPLQVTIAQAAIAALNQQ